jgi:hypothetical protein
MPDDIITRLLALNHPDAADAADEIEQLRKELAMLRLVRHTEELNLYEQTTPPTPNPL